MTKIASLLIKEIMQITQDLISHGLSIDQNYPSNRQIGGNTAIDWGEHDNLSVVLKDIDYNTLYDELEKDRNYSIKLIDGALLQYMYTVIEGAVISHRLAFFPCPYLEKFQNDPDLFTKDDLYADLLAKNIVPAPIRFDYDEDVHDHLHAKSHVTIGQYKNCRIPAWGPLSPYEFTDFILKNFYSNAYRAYQLSFGSDIHLDRTIITTEEKGMHFNLVR